MGARLPVAMRNQSLGGRFAIINNDDQADDAVHRSDSGWEINGAVATKNDSTARACRNCFQTFERAAAVLYRGASGDIAHIVERNRLQAMGAIFWVRVSRSLLSLFPLHSHRASYSCGRVCGFALKGYWPSCGSLTQY